ncbi:unnamed protein product [Lymnaea stagnalis]|uniref:CUB domain-containing protein n=1 Tax=Lymnaea stagnalis TaxID=6523 RepID=A0AAV2I060_LYMST
MGVWRPSTSLWTAGITAMLLSKCVLGQLNPALANDPLNTNAASNIFYFDSNSDCNGPIKNLFGIQATIRGSDLSSQRLGPTTCTIRLRSEGQFDGTVLDIEVKSMNILDCTTQVAIYDGDGAQILLMSYDCRSSQNQNRKRFLTSGNTATFIMTRQNVNSFQFDIEITINPVRSGADAGYENNYGKDNPFAFDKFPQEAIVGMISGFYVFILIICVAVIIYQNRTFAGLNKKWETHQLATLKTGIGFDAKSQMTQPSHISTVGGMNSRGPASQYSTHPIERKKVPRSEDGDSGVYYNEESFQKRRLMNEENVRPKDRYVANSAYSEPEDARDSFVEKVITSRVKTRNNRPPSYAEALSDQPSESSEEEDHSDGSSSGSSVGKRSVSSEEERSERSSARSRSTRSGTPSETESESESDAPSSRRGHRTRPGKPKKKKRRDSSDADGGPSRPRHQHQQPPTAVQMQRPPMQSMPYGAYPPGQFVPMMAGPPAFQPVPMVPGYPPPRYPVEPRPVRGPQVHPTDIPVYSYLVQRGYKPVEDSNTSQGSGGDTPRSGNGRLEEPELRLDSGVEYMRR